MKVESVLGIYREHIFSPGKILDDAAILDATLEEISSMGLQVRAIRAEDLDGSMPRPCWVLTMAQSPTVLALLDDWTRLGTKIVNSVDSVRNCYRKPLNGFLHAAQLPVPPSRIVALSAAAREITLHAGAPVWLKRGDVHAIQSGDVASVSSNQEILQALHHFQTQNVGEILVQSHVEGPVVKFYGVGRGDYFRAFLASTGQEITFEVGTALRQVAQHAAGAVGLEVYGGDAIMTGNGSVALIDLNDWPSFSRCCRHAAKSIALYLQDKIH
jgi:glutathione synthase/RimK-type ligase-like ATP-grasp enzyme